MKLLPGIAAFFSIAIGGAAHAASSSISLFRPRYGEVVDRSIYPKATSKPFKLNWPTP